MPTPVDAISWDGFTLGDLAQGHDFTILGSAGVSGAGPAQRRTTSTERSDIGTAGGRSKTLSRRIAAPELKAKDRATALRFIAALEARDDPRDVLPLKMRGLVWPDDTEVRLYARPEDGELDVSVQSIGLGDWRIKNTLWISDDPVFYAETPVAFGDDAVSVSTPGSHLDFVVDNVGTRTVKPGRALTFVINAHGGAVRDPFVEADGRRTTWVGKLEAGQSIRLFEDRSSWTGNAWRDGWVRGSSPQGLTASPAATWPLLKPGETTLRFGAKSGPIAVSGFHRSTW